MTGKLLSLGAVALALLLCVTFLSPIALAGDAGAGNDLLRMGGGGGGGGMGMGNKAMLGRHLYFDTNLSEPAGQSCASCHAPGAGWAEPDQNLPVSEGAVAGRFGNRNSPTSAYAAFSPLFSRTGTEYVGGQFWDGRAADLAEQAKGPGRQPETLQHTRYALQQCRRMRAAVQRHSGGKSQGQRTQRPARAHRTARSGIGPDHAQHHRQDHHDRREPFGGHRQPPQHPARADRSGLCRPRQ